MRAVAAKLRHTLSLQSRDTGRDALGGALNTWTTVASVRAEVKPLSGRAYWDSLQSQTEVSHQVTIRYRADVDAAMRFLWGTRVLSIVGPPIDPNEKKQWLRLTCMEGVKDDA